jgi:hypothetical protein
MAATQPSSWRMVTMATSPKTKAQNRLEAPSVTIDLRDRT